MRTGSIALAVAASANAQWDVHRDGPIVDGCKIFVPEWFSAAAIACRERQLGALVLATIRTCPQRGFARSCCAFERSAGACDGQTVHKDWIAPAHPPRSHRVLVRRCRARHLSTSEFLQALLQRSPGVFVHSIENEDLSTDFATPLGPGDAPLIPLDPTHRGVHRRTPDGIRASIPHATSKLSEPACLRESA